MKARWYLAAKLWVSWVSLRCLVTGLGLGRQCFQVALDVGGNVGGRLGL